ncbi:MULTISPECIES: ATP-dependent DNA helicase RecG [unclassified Burkholderia]|uniref:ATP-dependent DNA helicase RecG n=1 Tax=unclassified Burkholderia TaxID=2613784 RepID=UPI000F55F046|nr:MULTISPECIES: ATP-dependent DNA helicase RecG [unclassified Burkholderia]RQR44666.1 ATP-dependent DNA helicase RecG [Burkholderia sp. Bp9131]RQR79327.1 ATP-dependent DNA helicase RecG [Burkholderia sp. Bp9011]RQR89320.1 ATP-dependent DNA helicase RecG [Burkholderia sp. Bp9010]RQS00521.1 ATP-dependent DNA helicase RecG [Burkholderia sp. Bp8994]RQS34025.1 ATP-dependent DNA helicase RecG [Burkholderia sp. Bp8995]
MPVSPRRSTAAVADSADPFDADDAALPARSAGEHESPRGIAPRRTGPKRGADGRLAQPAAAAPDAEPGAGGDEAGAAGAAGAAGPSGAKRKKKPAADKPVKTVDKLAKLGLTRSIDLVLHLPMRYEDETTLTPIGELLPGGIAQTEGVVFDNEVAYRPRRQLVVKIQDDDGEQLVLRFLNFYGSQVKQMAVGQRLRVRGDVRGGFFGMEMVHPAVRVVEADAPLPQVLTPVYPSTAGVSQAYLRKAIENAVERTPLPELLPPEIERDYLKPLGVPTLAQAVRILHHPAVDSDEAALMDGSHPAWTRIKFEELLAQQLSLKRAHEERRTRAAPAMPRRAATDADALTTRLYAALPFTLTGAQSRVVDEIAHDLTLAHPMQRLLQGDVGSGKTVVAALAAAQAIDAGYQAALMAPTEILAEQHARKLRAWLEPLGVTVAWLAGSLKAKEKRAAIEAAALGTAQLVIGTHAIIQDTVEFARLGLVIVDEQHRFGVEQRLALRAKAANAANGARDFQPHQLMMSATPIPRTLAMTYYADLEVSTIDELPPGRTPVLTRLVGDARREEVIARVREAALTGRQVYWVCPLIEESETLQLQTAVETYETLAAALPELKVGLVHGRLSPADKAAVMEAFTRNDVQLLVATTVIEVGVDVPNASLMVIEHAERFGLAQLHQLRGRVGRGTAASVCVLLYTGPLSLTGRERLKTMRETTDGFEIARRDLEIRGPGEFLGARQSGAAMLRFANLETDGWLIDPARDAAARLIAAYPDVVTQHLARWLGAREQYLKA